MSKKIIIFLISTVGIFSSLFIARAEGLTEIKFSNGGIITGTNYSGNATSSNYAVSASSATNAGSATTAGSLSSNPANCTGDKFAKGIAANGVAECYDLPSSSDIYWSGTATNLNVTTAQNSLGLKSLAFEDAVTDAQVPNDISIDYAADAGTLNGQAGTYYNQRVYNSSSNYLGGGYNSGGSEKPNWSGFGAGKLKLQMLSGSNIGAPDSWNDVLWMSSYTGGDVKGSNALIFSKYNDKVGFVRQNYDSDTWGTYRSFITSVNIGSQSVNYAVSASSATNAGSASTASALASNPNNCALGYYARGIDASGAAENCTLAPTNTDTQDLGTLGNAITLTNSPSITAPYATLAGSLSSDPANCTGDKFAKGIAANGVAECADLPSSSGDNLGNHIATANIQLGTHWLSGDGGNEGVYVNSTGNVGIGTTNPGAMLQVDLSSDTLLKVGFSGRRVMLGDIEEGSYGTTLTVDGETGKSYFNNGNVGIGTTNPSQKLYVSGNSYTSGMASAGSSMKAPIFYDSVTAFYLNPAGTSNLSAANFNGVINISTTANPGLNLGNGSVGYLKIGASGWYDDGTYFSPLGSRNFYIRSSSPTTYIYSSNIYLGNTSGTTVHFRGNTLNGNNWDITSSGAATFSSSVTASEFIYNSDRNFKKDIKPLTNSLEKIQKLQGISFNWKSNGQAQLGLIAQDVQKVYPELVHGKSGHMGVQYGNLVAPLIEAIKEQEKEIENLQTRVKVLENIVNNQK